jgi:hypothetical protein
MDVGATKVKKAAAVRKLGRPKKKPVSRFRQGRAPVPVGRIRRYLRKGWYVHLAAVQQRRRTIQSSTGVPGEGYLIICHF